MSTISSKNQITLPVHLLRALGLKPGDRLAIVQEDGRLVLRPRPQDWVSYYAGSLAGVYGRDQGEADAHLAELRRADQRETLIEGAWAAAKPAAEE